jgi:long-chain-fatty-acid--[acyl-carrier-protein] ligase
LFALRYSVTVKGKKEVLAKRGPYLVLPNHIGFTDPPNVYVHLWPLFRFRPVANEINFSDPILGTIAAIMRTIKVPDMDRASADAHKRAADAANRIAEALKKGDNVLLWPSGRLTRDGVERLGGARAVSDVLAMVPEATVVLVRTRGLWGSWFSWAYRGPLQPVLGMMLRGWLILISNLWFFTPRRKLTLTVEAFTATERPEATREAINKWLEAWYEADTASPNVAEAVQNEQIRDSQEHVPTPDAGASVWPGEVPTFVPYHFLLGSRSYDFPPPHADAQLDLSAVKAEVKQTVADLIAEKIKRPLTEAENRPETTFLDLGIDSLDGMDITLHVEQRFGFAGDQVPQSIGQLWALGAGLAVRGAAKPPPKVWFKPPVEKGGIGILGDTVPEAFVRRCLLHPKDAAAADDIAGVVTYERLLLGARLLSERFRKFPEPNVGLMLPASVAGDVALLALHLAGKLPVVLNWTTGPANLDHAVKLMGLNRVVTSKAFIDRTHLSVPGVELVFLEEVRKTIGKLEGLRALLRQRFFPTLAKAFALRHAIHDPNAPAVVLFTSGSEKAPKAVPLTHANVLSNMKMTIPALDVTRRDTVLGFLPLFHSFGHTVTSLLPLLAGIKTLHHPDPTDAGGLVRKIAAYKPTLIAGTPTFMGYILDKAQPGDLDSLRLLVVGAEKCPEAIFQKAKRLAPNAEVVEGYGITECAPIVTFNPPGATKPGTIGKPPPEVSVRILDVDTHELVPQGQMGMMEVSGPNVFPGYIGHDGPSPLKDDDGKRWYVTGDLVAMDPDGYIVFHGRLKRFLKAGGEMISLPALEEPFAKLYPPTEDGPRVAVEGIETPDGRNVVLFTTVDVSLRDANAVLQKEGFRGVMRLDGVKKVDKIPVLGTGKTDYKVLRAMLTD